MKDRKNYLLTVLLISFLSIMIIFTLYPIIYTILGSFKSNAELTLGESFFPSEWHPENYIRAFVEADFSRYTINSVVVSLSVMAVATITSALAGYVFARKSFIGKKIILSLYISLMFIALGSVTLYPIFKLLTFLNLNESILGLIILLVGGQSTNVLLTMGYIRGVPKELDEAATIDGCNTYGIFFKIILPLIKPILAVVALFAFRTAWNDYIKTLTMTISLPELKTLTVAVVQLKYSTNAAAEWNIMLAGASIAIIPILIVYAFSYKQFIGGLTAGAVKG